MKHKFSFKATLWWVIALGLLGISILLFGEKEERNSLRENRRLSGFPALTWDSVLSGEFMTGFENYLSDSFFARDDLITLSEDAMGLFSVVSEDEILSVDIGSHIEDEFDQREEEESEEESVEAPAPAPQEFIADMPAREPGELLDREDLPACVSIGDSLNQRDENYQPKGTYHFWLTKTDGTLSQVYSYTPESIETLMEGLNAYKARLPENGTVHFVLLPVAQSANQWTRNRDTYSGWVSDAEEYMAALADDGVYIYNGPEILASGLEAGEYLYYRTDHHWTPRGAYAVAAAMLERQGLPVTRFEDYQYTVNSGYLGSLYSENPTQKMRSMADDIEIPSSLAPVHSYIIERLTESRELAYMANYSNYLAYLQGTQKPWRRIVTGFHSGRNALVISDSFGNCFAPYLVPYYDEVHMVDLRKGNFTKELAGYSVGTYMEYYGIDDVYVVLCTASGLNYNFTQQYLLKYLD